MRAGMKVRVRPSAQQTRDISPSVCGTDQPQDPRSVGGSDAPDDAEYEGRRGGFRTVLEGSREKALMSRLRQGVCETACAFSVGTMPSAIMGQ